MKVHIHQIPPEGLHLEGEESSRILDLHDESIQPAGDIHYALDVGLSEGGLFATGELSVDLDMECVACLERFRYPLSVPDFALPPHPHCDWSGERVCQGALSRFKTEAARETLSDAQETGNTPDVWGALDQLKIKKTN
jgi:hypothetical protein